MENSLLELSKLFEFNTKAEAQAVLDYMELARVTLVSEINEVDKFEILNTISELISDELNHQLKLQKLYTKLTNIQPMNDKKEQL